MPTKLTTKLLLTALFLPSQSLAHSWIEQIALINSNGTYYNPFGYSRGYVARTDPGFSNGNMTNLVPALSTNRDRINASDYICSSTQRTTTSQSPTYPRIKVAPGSALALRYLENGHVTLPQNQPGKPPMSGTTYVFGTTQPSDAEKIVDVLAWNRNGSAGDGRGKLLAANNYDDGRCHQINSGNMSQARQLAFPNPVPGQPGTNVELWCETDVFLPSDLVPGSTYTAYWVWDWKTEPGLASGVVAGKDEYYTTCMDFDVVSEAELGAEDAPTSGALVQQDGNEKAVAAWKSRTAVVADPDVGLAVKMDWGTVVWAGDVPPTADVSAAATATGNASAMTLTTSVPTTMATSFLAAGTGIADTTSAPALTYGGMNVGTGSAIMVIDIVTTTVVQMVTVTAAN